MKAKRHILDPYEVNGHKIRYSVRLRSWIVDELHYFRTKKEAFASVAKDPGTEVCIAEKEEKQMNVREERAEARFEAEQMRAAGQTDPQEAKRLAALIRKAQAEYEDLKANCRMENGKVVCEKPEFADFLAAYIVEVENREFIAE